MANSSRVDKGAGVSSLAAILCDMDSAEEGTWAHPDHIGAIADIAALLKAATGDPVGW